MSGITGILIFAILAVVEILVSLCLARSIYTAHQNYREMMLAEFNGTHEKMMNALDDVLETIRHESV